MLQGGKLFKSAKEIRETFESRGMTLDGISAHCPFWVHTSAWTGTKSGHPFIPPDAQAHVAGEAGEVGGEATCSS
jgi:hypothetical protein